MNEIERKQKIFQEILEEARLKTNEKLPGEFTINDFVKELKDNNITCGKDRAKRLLEQKIDEKILQKRITKHAVFYSVV